MEISLMVKKAKKGDEEAFINLMKQYEIVLYKVAKRMLINEDDVADALQDTIISAYENIKTLKNEKYFNTWICKILINKCNSILNKNKKIIPVEDILPQKNNNNNEFFKVELNDALNTLNKEYKLVLVLYYIAGFNIREISELTNEPEGTIKSRLSRAKTILREKYFLDDEGVILNEI
ncbi:MULTISPECIES: sigma-70 family RNA polymerase sigma factor [Caloramator]|nr:MULTISPECIES: sigma-70 family RNA polymerase sigma factor [Caloramator]